MAIELEFLPLDADELPVSKSFTIGNTYTFVYRKNVQHNRIYCEIRDQDDNSLYTTRLVYAGEMIHAVVDGLDLSDPIIPFFIDDLLSDKIGSETDVTPDNLDKVKQYVIAN